MTPKNQGLLLSVCLERPPRRAAGLVPAGVNPATRRLPKQPLRGPRSPAGYFFPLNSFGVNGLAPPAAAA
jgi:hypothetical protein